jgi:hypothetical protein
MRVQRLQPHRLGWLRRRQKLLDGCARSGRQPLEQLVDVRGCHPGVEFRFDARRGVAHRTVVVHDEQELLEVLHNPAEPCLLPDRLASGLGSSLNPGSHDEQHDDTDEHRAQTDAQTPCRDHRGVVRCRVHVRGQTVQS